MDHWVKKSLCQLSLVTFLLGSTTLCAFEPDLHFNYIDQPHTPSLQTDFEASVKRGIRNWSDRIVDVNGNEFDVDINVRVESHTNHFLGSSSTTPVVLPYLEYRNRLGVANEFVAGQLPTENLTSNDFVLPAGASVSSMVEISPVLHHALQPAMPGRPSIDLVLNSHMINGGFTLRPPQVTYSMNMETVPNGQHWDLEMIVTREIGKALGFQSNAVTHANDPAPLVPTALDLMVFDGAPGSTLRSLVADGDRVFNDQRESIAMSNGQNPGLWAADGAMFTSTGYMEDEILQGEYSSLYLRDLGALESIGYSGALSNPGSVVLEFNPGSGGEIMPGDVCVDGVVNELDEAAIVKLWDLPSGPLNSGGLTESQFVRLHNEGRETTGFCDDDENDPTQMDLLAVDLVLNNSIDGADFTAYNDLFPDLGPRAVPEPQSLPLIILGQLMILSIYRRRRRI